MTNRLAIALALVVVAFLILDAALGLGWGLFLAQKFIALLGWVAFWR